MTATPAVLRGPRIAALLCITALVLAASAAAFAESYTGLYRWALEHGYAGWRAGAWPLLIDAFIAGPELYLFVALVDRWHTRARLSAWAVAVVGLTASIGGNVGHVVTTDWATRASAGVPPLAAAASLWLGLAALKRIVARNAAVPARPARTPFRHRLLSRWRNWRLWHAANSGTPGPAQGPGPGVLPPVPVIRVPVQAIPAPAAVPEQGAVPEHAPADPPVPAQPRPPFRNGLLRAAPGGSLMALPPGTIRTAPGGLRPVHLSDEHGHAAWGYVPEHAPPGTLPDVLESPDLPTPDPAALTPVTNTDATALTAAEQALADAYRASLTRRGRTLGERALAARYLGGEGQRRRAAAIMEHVRQESTRDEQAHAAS